MDRLPLMPTCRVLQFWVWSISLAAIAGGCSTVPGTNRERLNFMSTQEMAHLGDEAYHSIISQHTVIDQGPDAARVDRIGQAMVTSVRSLYPEAELPDTWSFAVVEDETPNAFALPGAHIVMHTGMLELAGDDDAVAVVLGHEVAHVIARHAAERMSHGVLVGIGAVAADEVLKDQDDGTRELIMVAVGAGATVGIMLPYSRLNESEADELGLMIAAHAGFDPRATIPLWTRMQAEGEDRFEFLSTHPVPASRISHFRVIMPRAMRLYRSAISR